MAFYIVLALFLSVYAPYLIWQWRSGELDGDEEAPRWTLRPSSEC